MINRHLYIKLIDWKSSSTRKPLLLRGARQTGKTTLIHSFAKEYEQYLYFNLEKEADAQVFTSLSNLERCINRMFLERDKVLDKNISTLIFIDEAQELPEVIEALRYFYEDYPFLHVIVTGSLLEFAVATIQRTPVGRVEYMELHPINFEEYLGALPHVAALKAIQKIPIDNNVLPILYQFFHDFTMIGGMPEIVHNYIKDKNITLVLKIYASIIESYKSDVEKYARNENQKRIIRHVIDTAAYETDKRIKLNHFGASSFTTKEIKEAISALQKARYLELVYPTTQVKPPATSDFKKRPRLHLLDVGLFNYQLGLHQELLSIKNLNDSSRGSLIQQAIFQEINSIHYLPFQKLKFWVKEDKNTSSEVDLIYPYKHLLIPVEFKSGASGALKSLHEFMDLCDHPYAIRFYGGEYSIDQINTRMGKPYQLMNLPYFLAGRIEEYIEWFVK